MNFKPDERPTNSNDPATQRLTEDLHNLYNQPQPPRRLQNWSPSQAAKRQAQPVSLTGRSKKWQKEENALPQSNNGRSKPWITLAGIAACLVLALGLVALITLGTGKTGNSTQPEIGGQVIATQTPAPTPTEVPTPTLLPNGVRFIPLGAFSLGGPSPKVNVEMYTDYLCPACLAWNDANLKKLLDEYINNGKNVGLTAHFYPFTDNGEPYGPSLRLVEGAYCAAEQRHFWEYNSAIYAARPNVENSAFWTVARLKDLGKSIKLNSTNFDSCLDTEPFMPLLIDESMSARNHGITTAPSFLVNNQPVKLSSPTDYANLKKAIDAALNSQDPTPTPIPTVLRGGNEPTSTMVPVPNPAVDGANCKGLDSLSCAFKNSKYSQVTEKNLGQTPNLVQEFQGFQVTLKRVYVGPDQTGNNPALVLGYTINAPATMNALLSFHPQSIILKDSQGHTLRGLGGTDGPALFNEQGFVAFWQLPPNLKGPQKVHLEITSIGVDYAGQATGIEPVTVVPDLATPPPFPPTAVKGTNSATVAVPPTPTAVPGANEQPGNTGQGDTNGTNNQTELNLPPTPPPAPALTLINGTFSFDFEVDFK